MIDHLTVIPHVIVPAEGKSGDNFLIGLHLEVAAAHGSRMGTIDRGFSQDVCAKVAEVAWDGFTKEERLVAERIRARATLRLAGADFSPEDTVSLSVRSPVYWSVRPKSPGVLKGWIDVGEDSDANQKLDEGGIDMRTDVNTAFTITIHKETVTLTYALSVVGGILGTLLASVPAWLAWFDKRKGEQSKVSPIILSK